MEQKYITIRDILEITGKKELSGIDIVHKIGGLPCTKSFRYKNFKIKRGDVAMTRTGLLLLLDTNLDNSYHVFARKLLAFFS